MFENTQKVVLSLILLKLRTNRSGHENTVEDKRDYIEEDKGDYRGG